MTGQELLDYIRTDVLRDSAVPYLWSDALILRTLAEAENQFARKTYALSDDTQTITTAIDTATYDFPIGVLYVYSAAVSTSANDLQNYTRRFVPTNLLTATGTPLLFTCDEAAKKIRLYPVPDSVMTINLRTARLPSSAIATYSSPEIPEEYHLDLAEFVAGRLLKNNDVDGQSVGAADRHMADWNQRVSEAKREYYRMRTGANPNAASSWTHQRNR